MLKINIMVKSPFLMKIKVKNDLPLLDNKKTKNNKNNKNNTYSPLSGSELKYEPSKWNNKNVVNNHNKEEYIKKHKPLIDKYSVTNPLYIEWAKGRLNNTIDYDCDI